MLIEKAREKHCLMIEKRGVWMRKGALTMMMMIERRKTQALLILLMLTMMVCNMMLREWCFVECAMTRSVCFALAVRLIPKGMNVQQWIAAGVGCEKKARIYHLVTHVWDGERE